MSETFNLLALIPCNFVAKYKLAPSLPEPISIWSE